MRCEVETLGAFLKRISTDALRHGYYRYAVRRIPENKEPSSIDQKLIDIYGVTRCRMTRLRQRQKGFASVQYVRFRHSFVLLATEGKHDVFDKIYSLDARVRPIAIDCYTIGFRGSTVCVKVANIEWKKVENRFHKTALHDRSMLEYRLTHLPYYLFPGVEAQYRKLLRSINKRRRRSRLPPVEPQFQKRFDIRAIGLPSPNENPGTPSFNQ